MTKEEYDAQINELNYKYYSAVIELNNKFLANCPFKVGDFVRHRTTTWIFQIIDLGLDSNIGSRIGELPGVRVLGHKYSIYKECLTTTKDVYLEYHDYDFLPLEDLKSEVERIKEIDRIAYNSAKTIRRQTDHLYKAIQTFRCRVFIGFKAKGWKKTSKTQSLIGVPFDTAKTYIERQFKKGMTWDNLGKWHIDHIIPLSSAQTEEDLATLCHYTNLQPLWAKDNLIKSNKIPNVQITLTL